MPRGVTWGGFMGGFNLDATNAERHHRLQAQHAFAVVGQDIVDYIPHHNWFQYYASTANPTHARPSSMAAIGYSYEHDGKTPDPANHEYGLQDFYAAVKAGNFPAVSYIKLPAYQDGHAGYSDPLDEQAGTVAADQLPPAAARLEEHRDHHHLGRFRRLVRPRFRQDRPIASFDAEADQLDGPGKCGAGTPPAGVAASR